MKCQKLEATLHRAVMVGVAGMLMVQSASADMVVIDPSNLRQNVITALQAVNQTNQQIQQYRTQLMQYANMIQNTVQPSLQLWSQARSTMQKLSTAMNTLSMLKQQLGSIDRFLSQFKDLAAYRNSPCFTAAGCTVAQWQALIASKTAGSQTQKLANDAVFRSLDQQQTNMQADAAQLEALQSAAQGATGQLQAIGYANQLASQQSSQLLQIRALLAAEQNVIASRNQAQADEEALAQAQREKFYTVINAPTPGVHGQGF